MEDVFGQEELEYRIRIVDIEVAGSRAAPCVRAPAICVNAGIGYVFGGGFFVFFAVD